MKMLIRTDSSFIIGTGHVMRCLALAEKLAKHFESISFVCRKLDGNSISLIEEKQFKVITLSPSDSSSANDELLEITRVIKLEKPDWMLVDHYGLDADWEKAIQQLNIRVFVIDDLFRRHSCDGLLDQNYHHNHAQKILEKILGQKPSLFLGPSFALLSQTFNDTKPRPTISRDVKRILVFFGGTDPTNETSRFLQLIPKLSPNLTFDIVVGKTNVYLDQIQKDLPLNALLHVQTNKMAELMLNSDMYVGSGGSVTWERCYFGIPAICISVADNQIKISQELHQDNIHHYLGTSETVTNEEIINAINLLKDDFEKRNQFSKNSLKLKVATQFNKIENFFRGIS